MVTSQAALPANQICRRLDKVTLWKEANATYTAACRCPLCESREMPNQFRLGPLRDSAGPLQQRNLASCLQMSSRGRSGSPPTEIMKAKSILDCERI